MKEITIVAKSKPNAKPRQQTLDEFFADPEQFALFIEEFRRQLFRRDV